MESIESIQNWGVRLLSAILLGGMIGFERQFHGRPAGLRTHILVCLGACVITIAGLQLAAKCHDQSQINIDATRIAAGVITGIGFLGAGAIIRTGDLVRGLTTAACIWFTAGLGIAIGYGLLALAFAATILALFSLIALVKIEDLVPPFHFRDILVTAFEVEPVQFQSICMEKLATPNVRILETEMEWNNANRELKLLFHTRIRGFQIRDRISTALAAIPGVRTVAWKKAQQDL